MNKGLEAPPCVDGDIKQLNRPDLETCEILRGSIVVDIPPPDSAVVDRRC